MVGLSPGATTAFTVGVAHDDRAPHERPQHPWCTHHTERTPAERSYSTSVGGSVLAALETYTHTRCRRRLGSPASPTV